MGDIRTIIAGAEVYSMISTSGVNPKNGFFLAELCHITDARQQHYVASAVDAHWSIDGSQCNGL